MAKPNYSFEKRQREIAKKKKKEEKLRQKTGSQGEHSGDGQSGHEQPTPPPAGETGEG
jgi:hypothetical protein